MGVQGLSGFLKRAGIDEGDDDATACTALLPGCTTLAIDGNGLVFHLFRLAYHRHRRNVLSSSSATTTSTSTSKQDDKSTTPTTTTTDLQSQLLLPSSTPLALAHDVATTYLRRLTAAHGISLRIYFDGPQQRMKGRERRRRSERREDDWENLRELCLFGTLPSEDGYGGNGGSSRFRSCARRQAREYERRSARNREEGDEGGDDDDINNNNNNDAKGCGSTEMYLSSFPYSPLVVDQIERSILSFAAGDGDGAVEVVRCEGEADVEVARASARNDGTNGNDASGTKRVTYALAHDSDYLVYGHPTTIDDRERSDVKLLHRVYFDNREGVNNNDDDDDDTNHSKGETKYVRFGQVDPSSETLAVVGNVLTRSDVAAKMGLPNGDCMVELSILLGNDYTGPYLRHEDGGGRRFYRESLRWRDVGAEGAVGTDAKGGAVEGGGAEGATEEGEGGRLPPSSKMSLFDVREVAEHVAAQKAEEKEEGRGKRRMLTSTDQGLAMAIRYSYELYSFRDVSGFPTDAPGGDDDDDDDDEEEEDDVVVFPSLPREFDISLARGASSNAPSSDDLCEMALSPLKAYVMDVLVDTNDDAMAYVEHRHLDAFRMTLRSMMTSHNDEDDDDPEIGPPRRAMEWNDMRALYVLERCLLESIDGRCGANHDDDDDATMSENDNDDYNNNMPCRVFDRSVFHSYLESLSCEDALSEKEVDAKEEEGAFLEEVTAQIDKLTLEEGGEEEVAVETLVLPIDEHKEEILRTIRTQRVTIIHGETGCGKSSRVPCFVLRAPPPDPTPAAPEAKMTISQPRRIAAKALAERVRSCEPDLRDRIGLRMGHGIREHETSTTRAWFVTTGYVVRLLANHPGWFDSHTHLIIDEVHERSVDTDILCLLCRRLLHTHPTIRLVLMSATIAAELYAQYFGSPDPPIHVGARRFPIRETFVEDLAARLSLSKKSAGIARDVFDRCERARCHMAPSARDMEQLYHLAARITASVGGNGSSVLVFVPGMSDIEAIIELIEKLNVKNSTFTCLPIHSDVPFEEQMTAFEPPKEGEVKVIIATNAAESSLTLPDVDHVICLGLCKQIVYNRASHRQMLVPTWISRASATQRAGRTGRVRDGNVYRLYSRSTFHSYMQPFDEGELVRTPLDSTILSLREMLNEAVTPILLDCLEPPDVSTIERSFESLHASNFITDPSDEGEITTLGSLVVALGIDLTLGAFVGLGIQFGVANEAIQLAAILSFPQSPWAKSSPIYHDIETFNTIISKTFTSRCAFDAGLFSEPMAIANLLHDYSNCKDRSRFCWKHRISAARMRHLSGTVESLKRRVAQCLGVCAEVLEIKDPPRTMAHAKVNILRILQVWLFSDTIIVQNLSSSKNKIGSADGAISIQLDGPPIGRDHLLQVLDAKRHPFEIISRGKSVVQGNFDAENLLLEDGADYFQNFEIRFVSYVLEKNIDLSFYFIGNSLRLFVPADIWENAQLRQSIIGNILANTKETSYLQNTGGGKLRGRGGRACGAWYPSAKDSPPESDATKRVVVLSSQLSKSQAKEFKRHTALEKINSIRSILSCNINQLKTKVLFSMAFSGECHGISKTDLGDLFAAPDVKRSNASSTMKQCVNFSPVKSSVIEYGSSNDCPLIEDSPEGARLLSVLASERRRDNFIRFSDGPADEVDFIDVNLPKAFSINGKRWKRKDGGGMVYVPENCVPVAAIPLSNSLELFCCCANTLELRGGACRVEGITLLPRGRLFVGLALLCFGINPRSGIPISSFDFDEHAGEEKKEAVEANHLVQDVLGWIYEKGNVPFFQQEQTRVEEALAFHTTCMELGETLECQPDKIMALCALFDGVAGHTMSVWEGYDVSLKAAMAHMRPKKNHPKTRTDSKVDINEERQSEATVVKSTKESPKSPLLQHRQKCAMDKTGGKQSEQPNINDLAPKLVWVCPSSKEMFAKKKMCEKHIKSCSVGPGKQVKPKLMYVYEGCNKMFETPDECRSHMKGCQADSIATDAVPKRAKKKRELMLPNHTPLTQAP